jgi:Pyruvate/2-oxoacid:ferredoxin oxidoreductase delta subunit
VAQKNSVRTQEFSVVERMQTSELLQSKGLSVYPQRCVHVRNKHASCHRCAEACTSGAITFVQGEKRIDPALCVGCGTCATVCPTASLEAQHPNDASLVRAAKKFARAQGGAAVVCCQEAVREGGALVSEVGEVPAVKVICLSRLDESLLFTLAAAGVETVYGVHGTCEGCARKQGCVSMALVQETVECLARAWGSSFRYVLQDSLPEGVKVSVDEGVAERAGEGAAERAGEGAAAAEGASAAERASAAEGASAASVGSVASEASPVDACSSVAHDEIHPVHVQKDGTLPHFVPTKRIKLLDALEALGRPVQEEIDTRLWGHVSIDMSKCLSCKMCAVFCPTGALCKYHDEAGIAGIEHYAAECVHCGLCQDICMAHAITCKTKVPTRQLSEHITERYPMPDPEWMAGPTQILQRMRAQIGGQSVEHSY